MGRLRNTFDLLGSSWQVLKADKELLWLPVLSLLASLVIILTFILPVSLTSGVSDFDKESPLFYAGIFALYVLLSFITIFFNAALVHAAYERLKGGDPTVGSALRGAAAKAGSIFGWALVAATVSLIIQIIEEKLDIIGRLVANIGGIAWSLVTFLIIPVLVIENVSVGKAFKRSGSLFKETWGENVASQVGFGLVGFLLMIPAILLIVFGFQLSGLAVVFTVAVAAVWIILVSVVLSALNAIFRTALYLYATERDTSSSHFMESDISTVFAPKRRRH